MLPNEAQPCDDVTIVFGWKVKIVDSPLDITLDHLLELILAKKWIMKIDIESYECVAIQSASRLFQHLTIPVVLMEWYHTARQPKNAAFVYNFFKSRGYLPFDYSSETLLIENYTIWPSDIYWKKF